mgnify:CR=1 FL=1
MNPNTLGAALVRRLQRGRAADGEAGMATSEYAVGILAAFRKMARVPFVEQAFGAVAELARHQFGHEAAVAGVGDRQQQAAAGRQQRAALGQHARRLADVLQHVGTDDGVVAGGRKQLRQVGGGVFR